jgi:D-3-phosphoglycerate dehydrogenase / 2-oxoglutarate reductase
MSDVPAPEKKKILILDGVDSKAAEIFREAGFDVDERGPIKPNEDLTFLNQYVGLIVRSATQVTKDVLDHAPQLKVVGRAGTGVDNIDISAATERGILVMNANGNTIAAAEHTMAMMQALARHLGAADRSMKNGRWEKAKFTGVEITNKTLGLFGLGKIGSEVAKRAQGNGMRVIAFDPYLSPEAAHDLGVELVDKDTLLKESDFISFHTPKSETYILGREEFDKCKKGVRIIDCARGGLIDPEALYEALENGRVAGAALDVFEIEPLFGNPKANPFEQKLVQRDDVIATPHLGAATVEAQDRVAKMIATQLRDYLLKGAIAGAVNAPSLSAEERKKLGPHLKLAAYLGYLIGQVMPMGWLQTVTIEYAGEAAKSKRSPLTSTAIEWLLKSRDINVNQVNALEVARNRRITLKTIGLDDPGSYQTFMRLTVATEQGTAQITGTLDNAKEPRVVKVDDVLLEAKMAAYMLFIRSKNVPGVVAVIGTVLAKHHINIRKLHMGETGDENEAKSGDENVTFVAVDQEVSPNVIAELKEESGGKIHEVRPLNMVAPMAMFVRQRFG